MVGLVQSTNRCDMVRKKCFDSNYEVIVVKQYQVKIGGM